MQAKPTTDSRHPHERCFEMRIALYGGSFDPWTNGHHDVLSTALGLFDRVVVAFLRNPSKTPMFTIEERMDMVQRAIKGDLSMKGKDVGVVYEPDMLAVSLASQLGAEWMVRGIRLTTEYEKELELAMVNRTLSPSVQTVYIPPRQGLIHVSSTTVRQLIQFGDLRAVANMVPLHVEEKIRMILESRGETIVLPDGRHRKAL